MSGKTTSRNVNNANCGQPRGPIGACVCRLLQLCLPLPLSVHLYSPSLSLFRFLNRRLFVYFCCRWRSTLFFFVSCRRVVLLRGKENSPSAILLVAASSSWSVRKKKKPLSWSVISVTQSPRSTKIMMNVRGKLPTRIQHFKLPRGHVTVNGMSFCCCCCCCFFLTTKRQLTKDNFVISIQPWHGPGCLQEKEAWGKYTATGCLSSRFQNVIVFHSKVAQREIVLLFSPLRSDYRKATPRSYQQLFDGTEETGACCLWKTGL